MSAATQVHDTSHSPDDAEVITKAVLRAAERLALSRTALGQVLGVSPHAVSRLKKAPIKGEKSKELALLLIRVYRSLIGVVGDDDAASRWMHSDNTFLGGTPATLVQRVDGLARTLQYLDAMRAKI